MEPPDHREHRANKASRATQVLMVLQDHTDHGGRKARRGQRDPRGQREFKDMMVYQVMNYRKVPKFSYARKLCCNLPKIQTRRQTFGYFVKNMQMK